MFSLVLGLLIAYGSTDSCMTSLFHHAPWPRVAPEEPFPTAWPGLISGVSDRRETLASDETPSTTGRHFFIPIDLPAVGSDLSNKDPLTVSDRIQATLRCPEYWHDVGRFKEQLKRNDPSALRDKSIFWQTDSWVARKWKLPAAIDTIKRYRFFRDMYEHRTERSPKPITVLGLDEGNALILKIDLLEKQEHLEHVFKMIISEWLGAKYPKQRIRHNLACPWDVWSLHKKRKKTLLAITKAMFAVNGNPAYDPETKRRYQEVRRAYDKACRIYRQVRKEAGIRTR